MAHLLNKAIYDRDFNQLYDQYNEFGYESNLRYFPDETYSEYRKELFGVESEEESEGGKLKQLNGRRKINKKRNKNKWGRAQIGGNYSDLETDDKIIQGMDRIPYGIRNSEQISNELIKAVIKNDKLRIRQLILLGADINSKNDKGVTPLMSFCLLGKYKMVDILLNLNSDPNILTNSGKSIIPGVLLNVKDNYSKLKILQSLINHGADINLKVNETPIIELDVLSDLDKEILIYFNSIDKNRQRKKSQINKILKENPTIRNEIENDIKTLLELYEKQDTEIIQNKLLQLYINNI